MNKTDLTKFQNFGTLQFAYKLIEQINENMTKSQIEFCDKIESYLENNNSVFTIDGQLFNLEGNYIQPSYSEEYILICNKYNASIATKNSIIEFANKLSTQVLTYNDIQTLLEIEGYSILEL
jgi:uncharacterized LabA/DUF88 family protein